MQQAQMLAQMQTHVLDQVQAQLPGIEAVRVAYNRGVQDTTAGLGTNGSEVVKRTRQVCRSLRICIFTLHLLYICVV